jgi:AAA15 family ATPase/GTPase
MLIEFTVGNFRSFKEPVTFSMVAAPITAKDKEVDERNTFETGGLRLLKTAAVYGANASGKSNLVLALDFMRDFVLNSSRESQSADPIGVEPFRLSTETEDLPSTFEIVFLLEGQRIRYGFEVTRRRVVAEWLYRTPTSREAMLFRRDLEGIDVGASFKEGRGIEQRTRDNALFLSVNAQFNGKTAEGILQWFRRLDVRRRSYDEWSQHLTVTHLEKEEYKDQIIQLVKRLDLGINDIELEQTQLKFSDLLASRKPQSQDEEALIEAVRQLANVLGTQEQTEVRTMHHVFDRQQQRAGVRRFDLEKHESDGTKKLFALAGILVPALAEGTVMVIDELDARLHPLITWAIIGLFHNPETNPGNAQLIFTTHDTHLLDHKAFRRDQIWFVEKDRYGATQLYSLAEFRVRNDASYEKNYIEGRYGAVPFLGDLRSVVGTADEA